MLREQTVHWTALTSRTSGSRVHTYIHSPVSRNLFFCSAPLSRYASFAFSFASSARSTRQIRDGAQDSGRFGRELILTSSQMKNVPKHFVYLAIMLIYSIKNTQFFTALYQRSIILELLLFVGRIADFALTLLGMEHAPRLY